jgi:Prolyl oligopeptidase family
MTDTRTRPAVPLSADRNPYAGRRISLCFAPDGRFAASLAAGVDGLLHAEQWSFDGAEPVARTLPGSVAESLQTQVVPTPDGRVLALRLSSGRHALVLLESCDSGTRERPIADVSERIARLVPSLTPGVLGVLVTTGETTQIWQIVEGVELGLRRVLATDAVLSGGKWLDHEAGVLSVQSVTGGRCVPMVADLRTGSLTADPCAAGIESATLCAAHPESGLRLMVLGGDRRPLKLVLPDGSRRSPETLNTVPGALQALEFDSDGRRVAVHTRTGVRSRLFEHDLAADRVRELGIPAGVVKSALNWSGGGLRFLFADPACPTGLATVRQDGSWTLSGTRRRAVAARTEKLRGPAGPIESVVYGAPDWRRAPHLVFALHGGPAEHWKLDHSPLFESLQRQGIAVVALNQRGSTGYGSAYQDTIRGAWGVPDLADVIGLAEDLTHLRRALGLERPVLYGASYGAFLALLAIRLRPDLWRGCVAGAPFLSASRLHLDAAPPVRAMLERLQACPTACDGAGPRDLEALLAQGSGAGGRPGVHLLHGRLDQVIPVEHGREVVRLLKSAGWVEGRDLFYQELAQAGHELFGPGLGDDDAIASIGRFILHGSPSPSQAGEPATDLRGPLAAVC